LAEALADYGTVIGEDAVREGLASVQWPGRFQVIEGRPTLVLDVAHNPVSARVLRRGLEELLDARGGPLLHLVVGLAKDKDVAGFVQSLAPLAASVVCTRSHSGRAAAPEAVAKAARGGTGEVSCCATVAEAVARARDGAGPGDVVCITGSFHVVGEAMAALGINPMELD
jgi:dihydrofolate synthase/folylpolyglutamate synthase